MITSRRNVGSIDRWVSTVAGGALALHGLARRSVTGTLLSTVGAALAYRGLTGHCPVYETLGIDTTRPTKRADELVHEASEDSFPASDAPAWTPTISVIDLKR